MTSCSSLPSTALVLAPRTLLWTVGHSSVRVWIWRWICAIWQEGPKIKWQVTSWWGLCRSQAIDFLVIKFKWLILENAGESKYAKAKMVLMCGQYHSICFWWLTFSNHCSLWSKYCYHIPIYGSTEESGNSRMVPQLSAAIPPRRPGPATSIATSLDISVDLTHARTLSWPHSYSYCCSSFQPPPQPCWDCQWPQTEETPSPSGAWGGDFHSRGTGLWW